MKAVVSAGDAQTARAGVQILEQGGNAIDALVAAAFATWVVEPPLASAAGAGVLLHGSPRRPYEIVDFFTRVPGRGLPPVDPDAIDFQSVTIDYGPTSQEFHIGRGSVALPTAVWGLVDTHGRHGSLPLSVVIEPALCFARDGWVLSPHLQRVFSFLNPILSHSPELAAVYFPGGGVPAPGATMTNPGLATLFEGIRRDGRSFLDGPYTDALVDQFGNQSGGRLTREDLAHIPIQVRKPLRTSFAGHTVLTPPPPASGGTLVALALALAEELALPDMPWMGPEWVSTVVRIQRAVSIARGSGFDDAVFEPGAAESLLSRPALERWASHAAAEERNRGETTHISVITATGDAASLTQSNGEGCGYLLNGFGVHLNNFLGEEDINPGGFHRRPAGAPMTTMMTPTLVLDSEERPVMVAGSGGANRIRSAVFQAVLHRIGHGRSLHEAANVPRIHVEGDAVWFEAVDELADAEPALREEFPHTSAFPDRNMFFGGVNLAGAADGQGVDGAGDERRGGRHRGA